MVLLHFLRWLKAERPQVTFDVLLLRGGPLVSEFQELADVYIKNPQPEMSSTEKLEKHLRKRFGLERSSGLPPWRMLSARYRTVIANTAVSARLLPHFKKRGMATVCWLHELEYILGDYYTDSEFQRLAVFIDKFVVHSQAGKKMLAEKQIDRPAAVVHEFSAVNERELRPAAEVRRQWNIPADAFVVGGCGTIEWRKGTDLFIQLAQHFKAQDNVYFLWVGGEVGDGHPDRRRMAYDLKRIEASSRLIFTGQRDAPHDLFNIMDVFALTSREDPFPLVCIEAALLEKPIICFADAGGMPEFVENDAGIVVPYLELGSFGSAISSLLNDAELRQKLGHTAREKAAAQFAAAAMCERLFKIITKPTV